MKKPAKIALIALLPLVWLTCLIKPSIVTKGNVARLLGISAGKAQSKGINQMALPAVINETSGPIPNQNGTYNLQAGTDTDGYQWYLNANGSNYALIPRATSGPSGWYNILVNPVTGAPVSSPDGVTAAGDPSNFPLTGWNFGTYTIPGTPSAPVAPTFGATTAGATSLSINTQALTTNATSESVQYSTDNTFATGVSTIPVPTPGTAVVALGLVSGTTYYVRVRMTSSAGTVNGPAATVNFDTTGATFPAGSATINSAGTTLTLLATEFSPPLTAVALSGITISATGGPATLSGFAISSKTITATINRAITSGEIVTVSIPAGAMGDTASPTPNANAAVSGLAVVNNSSQTFPAPSAPGAPGVSGITGYGVTLAIPALTANALAFNVQYALDVAGSPGAWNTIGSAAPSSSAVITGLQGNTGGYFRLVAVGPGGSTNGISTAKVTTLMATERSVIFQGVQIAPETTPGTIVPATKRIISLQADPQLIIPVRTYRPNGTKSTTDTQSGQEMTDCPFSGIVDFMALPYLLASQVGVPAAPTTLAGGGYQWTFNLNEINPTTPQTYTVEVGGAQGASKFGYGFIPDLDFTFAKEEASVSGRFVGQTLADNITLTASLPELASVAAPPKLTRISLGTSSGSLTKLTRIISAKASLMNHFLPAFFRDDAQTSFSGIVEKAPDYTFQIVSEIGTDTDALLSDLRNNTLVYIQAQVQGPLIAVGTPNIYYLFQITMPVKVSKQPTRQDNDTVYGSTFDFIGAHDTTFGAVQCTVVNKLAAL